MDEFEANKFGLIFVGYINSLTIRWDGIGTVLKLDDSTWLESKPRKDTTSLGEVE